MKEIEFQGDLRSVGLVVLGLLEKVDKMAIMKYRKQDSEEIYYEIEVTRSANVGSVPTTIKPNDKLQIYQDTDTWYYIPAEPDMMAI